MCAVVYLWAPGEVLPRVAYDVLTMAAGAAYFIGVRRYKPRNGAGWKLIGAAFPAWLAAALVQDYYALVVAADPPTVSMYDFFNLPAYLLTIAGIAQLIRGSVSSRIEREFGIDMAIFLIATSSAAFELLILPVLETPDTVGLARAVAVAYISLGVAQVALLAWLLLTQQVRAVSLLLLSAAVAASLSSDIALALSVQAERFAFLHWVFFGYLVALTFFGLSPLHSSMVELTKRRKPSETTLTAARLVGLGSALFVGPVFVSVISLLMGREISAIHASITTALLVPLVLVRMWWLLTDKRDAEGRFRSLVHNSTDLTLVCNNDLRLSYVSPSSSRILGRDDDELSGSSLALLVHPQDIGVLAHRVNSMTSLDSATPLLCRLRKADGDYLPMEATFSDLRRDHAVEGVVLNLRDVTDREFLESQLRRAQKLESVGQLAAGIAHEINTPIQFVGDNLQFLSTAFDTLGKLHLGSPDVQSDAEFFAVETPLAIAQAQDGIRRVAGIVQAMKIYGHPDAGEMQLTDLNEAIQSTIIIARAEYKEHADVVTEFGDLPPVMCRKGDINQVCLNLIVNAAHAMADAADTKGRGTLTISTERVENQVLIRFSDTGMGIKKANMAKVFDPFFTTKAVGKGTGQGLALAHAVIIDGHSGSIDCESSEGVGTTFTLSLPCTSDQPSGKSQRVS